MRRVLRQCCCGEGGVFESELLPFSTVVELTEAFVVRVVVLMPVYIIWTIMPITYEHTPVVIILETLAEKIRSFDEKVTSVSAQTRLVYPCVRVVAVIIQVAVVACV